MRITALLVLTGTLTGSLASLWLQAQQGPIPSTFQSGVDVVLLDVSVLDKSRVPVRGLTAADFTVLEDGKPRPVVAFNAIDLPAPTPVATGWLRDVPTDVATNDLPGEGRLVVILLDRSAGEVGAIMARRIAAAAIDQLSPGDLAAVVFTVNYARPQGFTSDRARLLKALETPIHGTEPGDDAAAMMSLGPSGGCMCGLCVPEAITDIARALEGAPQRRKSLLFIGRSISIETVTPPYQGDRSCGSRIKDAREALFRIAKGTNLTITSIDPLGLRTGAVTASRNDIDSAESAAGKARALRLAQQSERDSLHVLAETTGGRALSDSNDPTRVVPAIFRESSSYYVLGFQSADRAAGKHHEIAVKTNVKGASVRARSGYEAPGATVTPRSADTDPAEATTAALSAAVTDVLPQRRLRLSASAAAFATPSDRQASVLVSVGVHQPSVEGGAGAMPAGSGVEHVELLTVAFDRDGRSQATLRQRLDFRSADAPAGYHSVARLRLPPGRYEIRVGVEQRLASRVGSVRTFVEVPDFTAPRLTMSDVVLGPVRDPLVSPRGEFLDLLPFAPTTTRALSGQDNVQAFARIYGGGTAAVEITTTILDAAARPAFTDTRTLDSGNVDDGGAIHTMKLPLDRLGPGEYLLTLHAVRGSDSIRRDLRFTVQ